MEHGIGRVTVFELTHTWPDSRCVVAYTTTGHFGDTAILGVIPVPGNGFEPGDLFAVAGRHEPSRLYGGSPEHARGTWLACTGYSARLVRKPSSLDLRDTAWSLDVDQKVTLDRPMFGNTVVMAGRMTIATPDEMEAALAAVADRENPTRSPADVLVDCDLMRQARDVLTAPSAALYGPVGQERSA